MRYLFLLFSLLLTTHSAAMADVISAKAKQVVTVDAQNVLTLKPGSTVYIDKSEGNCVVYDLTQTWNNQVVLTHNGKDIVLHDGMLLAIVNQGYVTIKARHSTLAKTTDNIYSGHFALHGLFINEPELSNAMKANNHLADSLIKAAVMQGNMRGEEIAFSDEGAPINSEYPFVDLLQEGVLSEDDLPNHLVLSPGILASASTVKLLINNMPVTFHVPNSGGTTPPADPSAADLARIALLEARILKAANRESVLKSLIALDNNQIKQDQHIDNVDQRQITRLDNQETKDSKQVAKLHAADQALHNTVHGLEITDQGLITDISNLNVTISNAQQAESTALIAINKDEAQIAPLNDKNTQLNSDVTSLKAAIASENTKTDKALIQSQRAQIKADNAQITTNNQLIKSFQSNINQNQSLVNKNQTLANQSESKISADQAKLATNTAKIATDRSAIMTNIKTIQADKMQIHQDKAIVRVDNRVIVKNTAQIVHNKTQVINDKARIQHIQMHINHIQHNINVLKH